MSVAELAIARNLRTILKPLPVGASIDSSDESREVFSALEFYLPEVFREVHHAWRDESLDGIFPTVFRKTGPCEVLIVGECILISDQTTTPIHVQLQISDSEDEITWLECRLGQTEDGKLKRIPYNRRYGWSDRLILAAADDASTIDWYYCIGFGERRV